MEIKNTKLHILQTSYCPWLDSWPADSMFKCLHIFKEELFAASMKSVRTNREMQRHQKEGIWSACLSFAEIRAAVWGLWRFCQSLLRDQHHQQAAPLQWKLNGTDGKPVHVFKCYKFRFYEEETKWDWIGLLLCVVLVYTEQFLQLKFSYFSIV